MRSSVGRKLGVFLMISFAAACAAARTRVKDLDDYFMALAQNQQFNGNVLVAENGKILYEKSFGYSDFPDKTPNTRNTIFPLASISKTITATAVLQLYQEGKLRLTDPAVKYLSDFPYPTITIRHLLSHTSGLPPYNSYFDSEKEAHPERVFTNADFVRGLAASKKPLLYQPGEDGNYDNINFIVLALVLEKVSGMPYGDYVQKFILRPARMERTSFFPLSLLFDPARPKNKNLAVPHWYPHFYAEKPIRADTIPFVAAYWHAYNFSGFSDYISTTRDLLNFDQALYDGRLLSGSVMTEVFTPVKLNNGNDHPRSYGLGWAIEKDDRYGKIVYHGGNAIGLSCVLCRNITGHQTVILFDVAQDIAHPIALCVFKMMNGQKVSYPGKSAAKIYGKMLAEKGRPAAGDALEKMRGDNDQYTLSEDEFNSLGYDLMGDSNPFHVAVEHKYAEALDVFKLNIRLFPSSWNAYDSCGEVLLKMGRQEEAIQMYRKSVELNPRNGNGQKILTQLLKNKSR
jgi:CubicO group peptidase (beta-lactamase class C family)